MMRRLRKIVSAETYAEVQSSGTEFHKVTLNDAIKLLQKERANLWLLYRLESIGWDALDIKNTMFGSLAADDILYICVTDSKSIQVGDEQVDPESALHTYRTDELENYIVDADPKVVKRYVTEYALQEFDLDEAAEQLLREGHSFVDMMESAQNLPQLNK